MFLSLLFFLLGVQQGGVLELGYVSVFSQCAFTPFLTCHSFDIVCSDWSSLRGRPFFILPLTLRTVLRCSSLIASRDSTYFTCFY
jgi:hypothetical protein